ncbi:hypothetical protein B0H12DRAFT_216309 [Mycena haematopus]|nr:hypothetical protein B0H12DRAFT_216309 [Mycena haematopus]
MFSSWYSFSQMFTLSSLLLEYALFMAGTLVWLTSVGEQVFARNFVLETTLGRCGPRPILAPSHRPAIGHNFGHFLHGRTKRRGEARRSGPAHVVTHFPGASYTAASEHCSNADPWLSQPSETHFRIRADSIYRRLRQTTKQHPRHELRTCDSMLGGTYGPRGLKLDAS